MYLFNLFIFLFIYLILKNELLWFWTAEDKIGYLFSLFILFIYYFQ